MNNHYLDINFIHHLNAFYTLVHEHERLCVNDISLSMALFQLWNLQHFPVFLMVSKTLIVKLYKIGSIRTYLRCLKWPENFGFLTYEPSERPFVHRGKKMIPLQKNEPHRHSKKDPHTWSNKDPAAGRNFGLSAILLTNF